MKYIEGRWGYFSPKFGLKLMLLQGSYFDSRYSLYFCFIWGVFKINLPFKTKLQEGCDTPRYGLDTHNNTLWLYWGGKYNNSIGQMEKENLSTWDFPFFTYNFDNHHVKNKEDEWQLVKRGEYSDDIYVWAGVMITPYVYVLKNEETQRVTAKCYKEKRQWHRKWFPFLKMVRTSIDIAFSDEVGERSGSWKGGVLGCGYDMLKNETMGQCLKRMEKERKFN